jgi:geranylgeranyl diphosphate synthase type II
MMRAGLFLAAAEACGADLAEVMPLAASIELLHVALLVHDDIQDESLERRGGPALHRLHGVPLALNAGDTLLHLALQPLLAFAMRLPPSIGQRMLAETDRMALETAAGQALELGWQRDGTLDIDETAYLDMVLRKTAWMSTIWPLRLGALVGTAPVPPDPERLARFGFFLGAAFQIQDDLLNLVADASYGKERGGDLVEGKRTLILIRLRAVASPAERARLDHFLALPRSRRTPAMVAEMLALIDRHGVAEAVHRIAEGLAGAALHEAEAAFGHLPAGEPRAFLSGLVPWVFERT